MHASIPEPFPQTEPATEFIGGRLVQKMSPRGLHARVQGAFVRALHEWADENAAGRVGTEWDFDLTPPGEGVNRVVPDIAFLSYERVAFDDDEAAEIPTVAPRTDLRQTRSPPPAAVGEPRAAEEGRPLWKKSYR